MELHLEEALQSAISAFRSTIFSVGEVGAQACPPVVESFQNNLANLSKRLAESPSPEAIKETGRSVDQELRAWGTRAAHHHEQKVREIKAVLLLVAKAASDVGTRDQLYASEFTNLAERLHEAAALDDLSAMRQSLNRSATAIQTCAQQLAKDTQETIDKLRAQVSAHEARLEEVERMALIDPLTGLPNRRWLEREIALRWSNSLNIIFMDINNFKEINDQLGHLAGDDLLKQFAVELRGSFRAEDAIGRWGGDEFVALVNGTPLAAEARAQHIQKWVNGRYNLSSDNGPKHVEVQAALGVASWRAGDTAATLLQRADEIMYRNKARVRGKNEESESLA